MRTFALITLIIASIVFAVGCRRGAGSTNTNGDANTAGESQFADITDPAEALAKGNQLLDDNQTETAIEAYKQAIKLDPDLAEAHFKLGIAYALIETEEQTVTGENIPGENTSKTAPAKTPSQKEFEKAVEAYKKMLAANPKDDVAQFNLGRSYNKLNQDDDAEDALGKAVKLKPDDSEYQTEWGAILIKLAQYHEAIPPLKKAIDLDPDNSRAADLLDDAEAGAKRLDFSQPQNDNKRSSNSNANMANANMSSNSNSGSSNIAVKPGNTTTKPTPKVAATPKKP